MPEPSTLRKARLLELKRDLTDLAPDGKQVEVQFNPDSLKVSFANQIVTPNGAGSQQGTPGRLFVGVGTTKLALQLWFDVTRLTEDPVNDVRKLTQRVAYFLKPGAAEGSGGQFTPHPVRFEWGTFTFDGLVDSMEETLDFWSPDGRPLRATVSLALSQQKVDALELANRGTATARTMARLLAGSGSAPAPGGSPGSGADPAPGAAPGAPGPNAARPPGTTPLTQAPSGSNFQGLADNSGQGGDWWSIAAANNIENPRMLEPGQLLDFFTLRPN